MTACDFSWRSAEEDDFIVIRSQPAIAVYLNPNNAVVIRQEGHFDEDHWIYITRENVPKLVHALLEAASFETGEPLALSKSEPLTAAERQRRYRNRKRNKNSDASVTERDELQLRVVAAE